MMKTTGEKVAELLKLWRMRQLTNERKILIFNTLAISTIVHLALVKDPTSSTMAQLEKIIYLENRKS